MRAVQRNNLKCVQFLLNETESDINGSMLSAYTPLYLSTTNGYLEIAKLLLNYGAKASIVYKNKINSSTGDNSSMNDMNNLEGHVGHVRFQGEGAGGNSNSLYLFSPLRASIVYSRFDIMIHLLLNGADVNELFDSSDQHPARNTSSKSINSPNEEYVNSLKFLYREFGKSFPGKNEQKTEMNEHERYFEILNRFISNKNLYRRMLLENVKDVCFKINNNMSLSEHVNKTLTQEISVNLVTDLTNHVDCNDSSYFGWSEYVNIISEFMISIDLFLSRQTGDTRNENSLPIDTYKVLEYKKSNYYQQMFEFSRTLYDRYFAPKSLKEICRYKVRAMLFDSMSKTSIRYKNDFLKKDHQLFVLNKLGLPSNLINFILHINN
jgi:hypothetical protein